MGEALLFEESELLHTIALAYAGKGERHQEAIGITHEGETLCIKHGRIRLLPGFAINRACDYLELGKQSESRPHFAQAYYGFSLVGSSTNMSIVGDYAKASLGIEFD